jgi:hypothetical protein
LTIFSASDLINSRRLSGGDIRVQRDSIVVTYYKAPNPDLMNKQYEHMSEKLSSERINPMIPWLYNFKLDFPFK